MGCFLGQPHRAAALLYKVQRTSVRYLNVPLIPPLFSLTEKIDRTAVFPQGNCVTFTVRLGGCKRHIVSLHPSGSLSPPAPGVSALPVPTRCSQRGLHPSPVLTLPQLCLISYGFVPVTNPKRPQETCREGPGVPPLPFRLLLSRGCCTVAHRRAETLIYAERKADSSVAALPLFL